MSCVIELAGKYSSRLFAVLLAIALSCAALMFAGVDTSEAKVYTGTYEYVRGHPELWGTGQGPQSGTSILCKLVKASGNKAKIALNQVWFYGDLGYYDTGWTKVRTVKLKNNGAKFYVQLQSGSVCKVKLKVVSRKEIRVAVEQTTYADPTERFPLSTGYKYRTLIRK